MYNFLWYYVMAINWNQFVINIKNTLLVTIWVKNNDLFWGVTSDNNACVPTVL